MTLLDISWSLRPDLLAKLHTSETEPNYNQHKLNVMKLALDLELASYAIRPGHEIGLLFPEPTWDIGITALISFTVCTDE